MSEKLLFTNGKAVFSLLSESNVFIKCGDVARVRRILFGEKFTIKNLSAGNNSFLLPIGDYEISIPQGCAKKCFFVLDENINLESNNNLTPACFKKTGTNDVVLRGWAIAQESNGVLSSRYWDLEFNPLSTVEYSIVNCC